TPRDRQIENRTGLVKFARIFSNVVSPPVMFAILGIAFAMKERPFWPAFGWAAVYGLLSSLGPIIVVLIMLKTGRISELHMSNTSERHFAYIAGVLFAAIAFGIISWQDGPPLLRCLALFNVIELIALGLINIVWLISLHSTGIMATFVLTGFVFGWTTSLIVVLPFVIAVCWVRLYLKRHTPAQVVAGLVLGAVSAFSLQLMGCF
ncbi:MAG: phosphatase PAP2 family protein, partial [Chloroflexi bacterium]|nr:phosphatase PAP2 family protein [Chloroflexota bacterium]